MGHLAPLADGLPWRTNTFALPVARAAHRHLDATWLAQVHSTTG